MNISCEVDKCNNGYTQTGNSCSLAEKNSCTGPNSRKKYREGWVQHIGHCEEVEQTRTCNNGDWTVWIPGNVYDTCKVSNDEEEVCEGQDNQKMYKDSVVTAPGKCISQVQHRVCNNGVWGKWTWNGTTEFMNNNCHVETAEENTFFWNSS